MKVLIKDFTVICQKMVGTSPQVQIYSGGPAHPTHCALDPRFVIIIISWALPGLGLLTGLGYYYSFNFDKYVVTSESKKQRQSTVL